MNPSEIPVDPASPFVGTLVVQLILAVACVGTMQRRKWLASQSGYVRAVLSAFVAMALIILLNGPSLERVLAFPVVAVLVGLVVGYRSRTPQSDQTPESNNPDHSQPLQSGQTDS
jgi:hypothetical protein